MSTVTVHTKRTRVRTVAERWAKQYEGYPRDSDKAEIGRRLAALDPERASASEADLIIGNKSWTEVDCWACGADVPAVVEVEDRWGEESMILCESCLRHALALVTAASPPPGTAARSGAMTRDERETLKALTDDLLEAAREAEGKLAADDGTHPSDAPWHYHRGESAAYRKAALLTHQRVPALLRDLETAEGLLRAAEWRWRDGSERECLYCHGLESEGHAADCRLAAFLGRQP